MNHHPPGCDCKHCDQPATASRRNKPLPEVWECSGCYAEVPAKMLAQLAPRSSGPGVDLLCDDCAEQI